MKISPLTDPYARQAVKAQAVSIAEVLRTTDDPTLPKPLADALAVVDEIARLKVAKLDVLGIAERLATAGPERLAVELDAAIGAAARQASLDSVLGSLTEAVLWGAVKGAIAQVHPEIASRVGVAFTAAVTALEEAAVHLDGDDPLKDHAGVLAAGAGDQWAAARQAVGTILATARVFDDGALLYAVGNAPRPAGPLVPVVNIDDLDSERITPLTHQFIDDDGTREPALQGRDYCYAVVNEGPEAAVVRVARGDFGPGVTLKLAADKPEIRRRTAALNAAFTQRFARDSRPKVQTLRR